MESLKESEQEPSPCNFDPDLCGEGNTESIVSLITGHWLIMNIMINCETLHLLYYLLPL